MLRQTHAQAAYSRCLEISNGFYTLAQRRLRQALAAQGETIPNQLAKPTAKPTLRWVFMCFQSVHWLQLEQHQQISNLTDTRVKILAFLEASRQKYYLLC